MSRLCEYCYNDLLPDGTCPECDFNSSEDEYEPRFCIRCQQMIQDGEWIIDGLCPYCADELWWEDEL